MRIIAIGLLITAALAVVGAGQPEKYQEGQVWEYRARSADVGSLLRIQKIEPFEIAGKNEPVYHISVIGLHFRSAFDAGGVLQHIPVSRATLDASVTRLSSTKPAFPDPSAGIAEWRTAKGGVFTIPVAEIVASIETMLPQSAPG